MPEVSNLKKKLCVVLDTNIINKSLDFNNINSLTGNLKRIYDTVQKLELENIVDILIPDIVLEEEKKHYIEKYLESKEFLMNQNFDVLPGFNVEIDESIDIEDFTRNQLESLKSTFLEEYNILTNMGMTDIYFKDILDRALEKRAPFEGKNGKSDKGFKDAVLWENILKYRENRPDYKIVFVSGDKIFNKELEEEYFNKFDEQIHLYRNIEDLYGYLTNIAETVPQELINEIKLSRRIKEHLGQSKQTMLNLLKEWLEEREAYGPGIEIFDILTLEIKNLVPSEYSTYIVEGDYYALLRFQGSGSNNGKRVLFSGDLYVDISLINDEKDILLSLTGLTLSSNEY